MDHILHIFRKDGRRHWPEILASLLLLALYAHLNVHPWQKPDRSFLFGRLFSLKGSVTPVLLLFWSFMIVRVVQSETLVGDRQWWITKPYEWWKLLFAKLFFVVVVILLPLFFVQLYLLHGAGFPVFDNLLSVLSTEFSLTLFLFVPCFCVAALSKGLGQVLLAVVAAFLAGWALYWVSENAPSGSLSGVADAPQAIQVLLGFGTIFAVILLQFARRRIWWSRGLILSAFLLLLLINRFTPYAKYVEHAYPLVENAPAQISIRQPNESIGDRVPGSLTDDISLQIPAKVSGVNKGSVVLVDGIKLTIKSSDGKEWTRGWSGQWKEIWPEDERESFSYQMKRQDYEKFKGSTVSLQIELVLWESQGQNPTTLIATGPPFRAPLLGLCRLGFFRSATIECLQPLHTPGLMATFDPKQAHCYLGDDQAYAGPEVNPVHAWLRGSKGDFPEPGISPLDQYSIYFTPTKTWIPNEDASGRSTRIQLCPGTKITLATPKEKWRGRLKFHIENVSFDSLLGGSFQD